MMSSVIEDTLIIGFGGPSFNTTTDNGAPTESNLEDCGNILMNFDEDDSIPDIYTPFLSDEDAKDLFDQEHIPTEPADSDSIEGSECEDPDSDTRAETIDSLEELAISFLSQLCSALPPVTAAKDTESTTKECDGVSNAKTSKFTKKKIEMQLVDRKKISSDGSYAPRFIRFPQKAKGASAKPFAQLFRLADLAHEALVDNVPTTKRDMYYKDVPLFKSQAVVDRLVDDLAATLQLGRSDLNVRAASKGLFSGEGLVIHLRQDGDICGNNSEGMLIPAAEDISHFEVDDRIAWVLIVEKEAVFQTLCRYSFASRASLPGPGIIITGKGYPDVATRRLVKTLSDNLAMNIPILALVDGDAYGIDILSVYKYGSTSMRHESEKLAAERVRWLGIWSSELGELGIDKDALIPITAQDEKKARALLRRPEAQMPEKWRRELMHMVHMRRKAEIEILSTAKSKSNSRVGSSTDNSRSLAHSSSGSQETYHTPAMPTLLHYLSRKITAFTSSSQLL